MANEWIELYLVTQCNSYGKVEQDEGSQDHTLFAIELKGSSQGKST